MADRDVENLVDRYVRITRGPHADYDTQWLADLDDPGPLADQDDPLDLGWPADTEGTD